MDNRKQKLAHSYGYITKAGDFAAFGGWQIMRLCAMTGGECLSLSKCFRRSRSCYSGQEYCVPSRCIAKKVLHCCQTCRVKSPHFCRTRRQVVTHNLKWCCLHLTIFFIDKENIFTLRLLISCEDFSSLPVLPPSPFPR